MAMTLITTNTESGASSSAFTSDIDSTYKLFIFKFYDINPDSDSGDFQFQVNASGQSGYNETVTSTSFTAEHDEADSVARGPTYQTGHDQANGTSYIDICYAIGNDADEVGAGELFLFNPSNTTYVKHYYAIGQSQFNSAPYSRQCFSAGYINVTAAITEVSFKVHNGNFDGTIKLYGVG